MTIIAREPYIPNQDDWTDCLETICYSCATWPFCDICEAMIEAKDGGNWPEGGWVTDPGAEMTCLSYRTKQPPTLSRPVLKRKLAAACSMCEGCAARKGSEASQSLHTQRDFNAAVNNRFLFTCHDSKNNGAPCGGWADAVRRKRFGRSKEDQTHD